MESCASACLLARAVASEDAFELREDLGNLRYRQNISEHLTTSDVAFGLYIYTCVLRAERFIIYIMYIYFFIMYILYIYIMYILYI